MNKVVLAYSGGLDTSVCIHWLRHAKGLQVVTFTADLGQGVDGEILCERALASGADSAFIEDLRRPFVCDYIHRAILANAVYETGYYLTTALGRGLIAEALVRKAREESARYVAHGCTGKGNDQVRFEASIAALAPDLQVIAPVREWDLTSREAEIEYAKTQGIPIGVTVDSTYSIDRNLWGVSIECGPLEDPWAEPPAEAYLTTVDPARAPDEPAIIEVSFEAGVPVALGGERPDPVALIQQVARIGARHGVGRSDLVEDRVVGIKSREIYEAPAAAILITAHRALEALTLSREVIAFQEQVSQRYARLIYDGLWFSDLRKGLDAFLGETQRYVNGTVRLKLYKGRAAVIGRTSPNSLYDFGLATYGGGDTFRRSAAKDFIHIWSLPLRAEAKRRQRKEGD
ncbi:MAG: argininosuccinate synthase [Planctomycetes bacterium DG_20]|nr:MAG: argininosuccinate synthase [Planctomycetes bacterium DG_20]